MYLSAGKVCHINRRVTVDKLLVAHLVHHRVTDHVNGVRCLGKQDWDVAVGTTPSALLGYWQVIVIGCTTPKGFARHLRRGVGARSAGRGWDITTVADAVVAGYGTNADGNDAVVRRTPTCAGGVCKTLISIQNTTSQQRATIETPDLSNVGPREMLDRVWRRIINPPIR